MSAAVVAGAAASPALATSNGTGDIASFGVNPASLAAGSHPNVPIVLNFNNNGSDSPESMQVNLASGFWGSLTAGQPDGTVVASGSTTVIPGAPFNAVFPSLTAQLTLTLTPTPSDANSAQGPPLTGVNLHAHTVVLGQQVNLDIPGWISVGKGPNMVMVIPKMPNSVTLLGQTIPLSIQNVNLPLSGSVNGKWFTRLPTKDVPATSCVSDTTYNGATGHACDSFTPTGKAPFSPGIASANAAVINKRSRNANVSVTVGQGDGQSGISKATVTLPSYALQTNSGALIDLTSKGTKVGNVSVQTPLLPYKVPGNLMLSGTLTKPALTLNLPSLGITIHGSAKNLVSNPQITLTGIPDVPISKMTITTLAGTHGLFNGTCYGSSHLHAAGGKVSSSWTSWANQSFKAKQTTMTQSGCPPFKVKKTH